LSRNLLPKPIACQRYVLQTQLSPCRPSLVYTLLDRQPIFTFTGLLPSLGLPSRYLYKITRLGYIPSCCTFRPVISNMLHFYGVTESYPKNLSVHLVVFKNISRLYCYGRFWSIFRCLIWCIFELIWNLIWFSLDNLISYRIKTWVVV
jgi:hypothetical protein